MSASSSTKIAAITTTTTTSSTSSISAATTTTVIATTTTASTSSISATASQTTIEETTFSPIVSTLDPIDTTIPPDGGGGGSGGGGGGGITQLKFPYPVVVIVTIWVLLAFAYVISRWRQKGKSMYVIPRVFVLCSPRTVQFHYELILRIGLPSYDFNPEKHDIDLTVQGQQKNEIVPMTRLNTKTLLDEPLITSLSIVVYRLVEMPPLGGLILKHSGPFKSWLYAYDFTVIDLSTNKEQYYTLNQYIGSLNRVVPLEEPNNSTNVQYPIDDVPLPSWLLEDIFLFLYTIINCIMLSITMMPINCTYINDIICIFLTAAGAGSVVFFLDWFLYYYLRWNQDRREYFNEFESSRFCPGEISFKIILGTFTLIVGLTSIYFTLSINELKNSLVWFLTVLNSTIIVIGIWNFSRLVEIGESIVSLGLQLRGIVLISVGMRYSEMVGELQSKSGSASDDGGATTGGQGSNLSASSKLAVRPRSIGFGTRSSVKSFGFDPHAVGGAGARSRFPKSRASSTGATPNTRIKSQVLRPLGGMGALRSNLVGSTTTGPLSEVQPPPPPPPPPQQQPQPPSPPPTQQAAKPVHNGGGGISTSGGRPHHHQQAATQKTPSQQQQQQQQQPKGKPHQTSPTATKQPTLALAQTQQPSPAKMPAAVAALAAVKVPNAGAQLQKVSSTSASIKSAPPSTSVASRSSHSDSEKRRKRERERQPLE